MGKERVNAEAHHDDGTTVQHAHSITANHFKFWPVSDDRYSISASSTKSFFVSPFSDPAAAFFTALACAMLFRCSRISVLPATFKSFRPSLPPVCKVAAQALLMILNALQIHEKLTVRTRPAAICSKFLIIDGSADCITKHAAFSAQASLSTPGRAAKHEKPYRECSALRRLGSD